MSEGAAVDRAERLHPQVRHEAGPAEGVAAGGVHGGHKRLKADVARHVLVDIVNVVVEVRLVGGVVLATRPADPAT